MKCRHPAISARRSGAVFIGVSDRQRLRDQLRLPGTVTDSAGNAADLTSLIVNGQVVGDAQGYVRGTFGSVVQPIDATASNIQTVTYTPPTSRTLDRWGNVLSQTLSAGVKTTDGQGNILAQSNPDPVFSTVS